MRRKRPGRIATGARRTAELEPRHRRPAKQIAAFRRGSGLPREALRSRLMRHLTRRTATRYRSLDNARGYPRFRGPRWTWPGRTGRLVEKATPAGSGAPASGRKAGWADGSCARRSSSPRWAFLAGLRRGRTARAISASPTTSRIRPATASRRISSIASSWR